MQWQWEDGSVLVLQMRDQQRRSPPVLELSASGHVTLECSMLLIPSGRAVGGGKRF
jgi:hypothetical protein